MGDNEVIIMSTDMTKFGRHDDASVQDLSGAVVRKVLADGGIAADEVDAAFFANTTWSALQGQLMVGGQIALRDHGIAGVPVFNVENACASGATALHLAINYVRAGQADIALAVGVEKMHVGDRLRTLGIFDGAYDVSRPEDLDHALQELGGETARVRGNHSIFMDIYAAIARAHMRSFGTTQEQIAAVAVKNHGHAVSNEKAFYRQPLSIEEVLGGRALDFPLTVPMCAPITDGAAAVLVGSRAAVDRLGGNAEVRVAASVIATGADRKIDDWSRHVTTIAAQKAYRAAEITPGDIDVAEVHDATAFAEILLSERLGLCEPGQGGPDAWAGRTSVGGDIPINPSGGLVSKGHPLGATGLAQIHELVEQLRGQAGDRQIDGARIAAAENGGGFHRGEEAVATVTILRSA